MNCISVQIHVGQATTGPGKHTGKHHLCSQKKSGSRVQEASAGHAWELRHSADGNPNTPPGKGPWEPREMQLVNGRAGVWSRLVCPRACSLSLGQIVNIMGNSDFPGGAVD